MTRRGFLVFSLITAWLFGLGTFTANAQGIKERMKARIPAINALKDQGVLGEGADGLLHFVGNARPNAATVGAENADRKSVYAAIAKQQGTSAAAVGQRRALQLIQIAKPGHWIQQRGAWKKK